MYVLVYWIQNLILTLTLFSELQAYYRREDNYILQNFPLKTDELYIRFLTHENVEVDAIKLIGIPLLKGKDRTKLIRKCFCYWLERQSSKRKALGTSPHVVNIFFFIL